MPRLRRDRGRGIFAGEWSWTGGKTYPPQSLPGGRMAFFVNFILPSDFSRMKKSDGKVIRSAVSSTLDYFAKSVYNKVLKMQ